MKEGTMVRDKKSGKTGIVVPDQLGLSTPGYVMVDFAGDGEVAMSISSLEDMGPISVHFEPDVCSKCAFANSACHRYDKGRWGWMMSRRPGRRVPIEGYPDCKEEFR